MYGQRLSARAGREIGKATRNPAMVAMANQVRGSLRGPLGTILNLGRRRDEERDPPPALPTLRAPRTPFTWPFRMPPRASDGTTRNRSSRCCFQCSTLT